MNRKQIHRLCVILILAGVVLLCSCQSEPPCGGAECTTVTYTYLADGDCELKADVYSPPGSI